MTSIEFAEAARTIGEIARRSGVTAPAFQSPPRVRGSLRSIRRRGNGSATVSVALKGRPRPAILADMIEGVLVTNEVAGNEAATLRDAMWLGVSHLATSSIDDLVIDLREQLVA